MLMKQPFGYTVATLIEALEKLPPDAEVHYDDGEYNGSQSRVCNVDYKATSALGRSGNTVLLK